MNKARLHRIFTNYITKFESFNQPEPKEPNETFKWHIAYHFRDLMNPDRPDFAQSICEAKRISGDLIDGGGIYPFFALTKCAKTGSDPDSVKALQELREIFRALFADDGGDLFVRQKKIDKFIEDANALIARCHSTSNVYMNDQRSAMAYLAMYDPDDHYLYKAKEANSFASCIRFFDDWGSGANFRMDVYYRMCDALVQEIRNYEPLLKTHESRYTVKDGVPVPELDPDRNYHILAFDIIYGASADRYNFYDGITFSPITLEEQRLYQERVAKIQKLTAALETEQNTMNLLAEAKAYFRSVLTPGTEVRSCSLGAGRITALQETAQYSFVKVKFEEADTERTFLMMQSFANGQLSANIPDMPEKLLQYKTVLDSNEENLRSKMTKLQTELDTYKMLLDEMIQDQAQ